MDLRRTEHQATAHLGYRLFNTDAPSAGVDVPRPQCLTRDVKANLTAEGTGSPRTGPPWQTRSWLTSHDPEFWEKASDVCGLYLNPPENAIVLSVDEKTEMHATSPTNHTKKAKPGQTERREFEYRRHSTKALFAALDVHTGEVIWETQDRNRSVEFISFLERLDPAIPAELTLHLVLDNGASHTSKQTRDWECPKNGVSAAWPDMLSRFGSAERTGDE